MALQDVSTSWCVAVLLSLLALPPSLHGCPQSCSCPGPQEVHCTFRHLAVAPSGLPKDTERINLGYNNIQAVGVSDFSELRHLKMLMLHGNGLNFVSPGVFYSLRSLQILKLSYNKLKRVTLGMFEGLSGLVRLHLDHNTIEFIEPFSFNGLTSLKLLQLEGNQLRELHPHTFITVSFLRSLWNSSLRHLHLADNRLEYLLPETLQHLDKLEALSLHGNPWACDCYLQWLIQWSERNKGVIKCKKDHNTGPADNCAACSTPQYLNNSQILQISPRQLLCERPTLSSPLKLQDIVNLEDSEPSLPYTKDLEPALGHLAFVLSDSHGNRAQVLCVVKRPGEGSSMTWESLRSSGHVLINATIMSLLECEIDRDELQKLWRLVAYYYESPAILERGQRHENTSKPTFQYSQAANDDSPYFTELKGHILAEPEWLLQPRVTLQLNRRKTTSKKLVLNFSTIISEQIAEEEEKGGARNAWAMIERGSPGRVQAVVEGSDVKLECKVLGSGGEKIEWMLPDLTIVNNSNARLEASESGVLTISKTTLSDSGLYYCLLQTKTEVDVVSYRLTVKEILLSPNSINGKEMSVERGEYLVLPCTVSSVEPSRITWFLPKSVILQPSLQVDRIHVSANGTLVIEKSMDEDAGEYSCLASNLYGVDMLSHVVVVTGSIDLDHQSVREVEEHLTGETSISSNLMEEDLEGEGSGFQETKQPKKSDRLNIPSGNLNNGNKRKRVKESKRKLNKSVKMLDPNRWAQMLAKAHAKASTISPVMFRSSPAARIVTESIPMTMPIPTIITTYKPSTISTTTISIITDKYIEMSTFRSKKLQSQLESTEMTSSVWPQITDDLNQGHVLITFPKTPLVNSEDTNQAPFPPPLKVTQTEWPTERFRIQENIKPTTSVQGTNRQRPPYRRRRPPHSRIKIGLFKSLGPNTTQVPFKEESLKKETESYQSRSTKVVGSPIHTAGISRESTNLNELSENSRVLKAAAKQDIVIFGISHTTTQASNQNADIIYKTIKQEKQEHATIRDSVKHLGEDGSKSSWWTPTKPVVEGYHSIVTEFPMVQSKIVQSFTVTKGPSLSESAESAQPSAKPESGEAQKQAKCTKITTQSHLHTSDQEGDKKISSTYQASGSQDVNTKSRLKSAHSSILSANHPWLLNKQQKVNIPTQLPATSTSSWTYSNRFPGWPLIPSSRLHPWHSISTGTKLSSITNKPEITALTMKTTVTPSRTTALATVPPLLGTLPNRSRDYILFSRLRTKYRQSQLGTYRLSQSWKFATVKPKISSLTPKLHESLFLEQSYTLMTSDSLPSVTGTPHSTATILHGSQWHYSHWGDNKLSTALPFPNLLVNAVKPKITTANMISVSALAETDVVLPCESTGEPEPLISWTKVSTGATIEANTKYGQRFKVHINGTFVINSVQLQDRGQYFCTALNKYGSDRMVITLTVQTQLPKILPPSSRDVSIYLGRPVSLNCIAEGKPQSQISWILPDKTFVREVGTPSPDGALLLSNGSLWIPEANFSSKGDYKCIASNAAGADTVTYHLHVAALTPIILQDALESITMLSGRSVYVHCTARGEPLPVIKWNLPSGEHVKPSQFLGGRFFVFPNGTLYVKSSLPADSGYYECLATNVVGSTRRLVELNIKQNSPAIRHEPSRQHKVSAIYGSTVYLHCPESTNTQHNALWMLPSKTLLDQNYSSARSITTFPNGTLRIQQLTEKDGGSYICRFQRPNGDDMEFFQVEVLMKPPKIEYTGAVQKKVIHGTNFFVDCVVSGLPDPEISWSLPDGTTISNVLQSDDSGMRSRRYVIFENGTLFLPEMDIGDEGDYTCYAKNEFGTDEMRVSVMVVQDITRSTSLDQFSIRGRLGDSVYLKCEVKGDTNPTILWLSPNNEVITSSSTRYQMLWDGTLIIRKLGLADRGKYACVARSLSGDNIKNLMLDVEAQVPQINGRTGKSTIKLFSVAYQTVLLDCIADGMPEPRITWKTSYGISLPTPYLGGRFQVHSNGSLEVRGLRKTDEGRFLCLAKNDLGEASLEIILEVASHSEKPSFAMPNIEVLPLKADNGELMLECPARGKPAPEFVWFLPNSTILNAGSRLQRFIHYPSNGTLRILQPVMNDKGIYRCLAKNIAGQSEKRYSLEPGRKPHIRGTLGRLKISFGQNLNLPCSVDAWPPATISWTLPSGLVLDKPQVIGKIVFLANGTLQLRESTTFDRGTYICKATNTFGSYTLSYPVAVMVYPPRITSAPPSILRVSRGSSVHLDCIAVGTPKPDISWTLPGRTTLVPNNRFMAQGGIHMTVEGSLVIQNPVLLNSGIYKCNAKNALGTDFKATYLQVI